jgi:hypothetical protein
MFSTEKVTQRKFGSNATLKKSNIQWQVLRVLGLKRLTLREFNQVNLRSYNTEILLHKGNHIERSLALSKD